MLITATFSLAVVDSLGIAHAVSRRHVRRQYAGPVERQPEAWETAAAGPCATIDGPNGPVQLWVLGNQRYRVKAPSGDRWWRATTARAKSRTSSSNAEVRSPTSSRSEAMRRL